MNATTLDINDFRGLEHLEFLARQVVEGFITGLHKSPYHGFSVEFSEHRIYNPGESIKNIDWKLYGRTDRLYVKRYEEETNLRCRLVIDASSSMYFPQERLANTDMPNKILFSAISALAITNMLKTQRDAVGLQILGNREVSTPARTTFQHHKMMNLELYKTLQAPYLNVQPEVSLAEGLHHLAQSTEKRSLIVLFSDLFEFNESEDAILDAFQHLKHQNHEIILFWTTDKKQELEFDFEARPYRFVDMETGQKLKLNPAEAKEAYRQSMDAFKARLRLKCLQYKIDFIETDVSEGYFPVLQNYLLKRKKMY